MILNTNADLLILFSYNKKESIHGLSGHLFEVLDYYYYFKKKNLNVKCLIPEVLNKNNFYKIINNHYLNLEFDINDFYFDKPDIIKCKKLLLVDGNYNFINEYDIRIYGEIYSFACGFSYFYPNKKPENLTLLYDKEVYGELEGIEYVKKILPHLNYIPGDREFAYITHNCRKYDPKEIIKKYPNILIYSDYLCGKNITHNPVLNWNFSKYIYTPISRKFDCSPRQVIECRILNIPIEYWKIDYKDPGLEVRKNNVVNRYILTENDELLDIIF